MAKQDNFTSVFATYSSALRRYLSRLVLPHDIDDILQETFIKSYQADLKEKIKYPKSYMRKTARNLAFNHQAKWDNKFSNCLDDFSEPPPSLETPSLEAQYETKERFLLFCRSVEKLSGPVRQCFILKKVYGLSQREIADYLKISQSTVEKHVAKGLLLSMQYLDKKDQEGTISADKYTNNNRHNVCK